jgi:SAM-dependent methyltransferase
MMAEQSAANSLTVQDVSAGGSARPSSMADVRNVKLAEPTAGRIEFSILRQLARHYRRLDWKHVVKGLSYERCAELTYIIKYLAPFFNTSLRYLDIGSGGESPLPTYLLRHSQWDVTCIDKAPWIQQQHTLAARAMKSRDYSTRFHVIEQDFLANDFAAESVDIITNVSVIEHFEGGLDSKAIAASARLLKPGGLYILTTPVNEGFFREYYVTNDVYAEKYAEVPVYYQRHYDLKGLKERLITPSGLCEVSRVFFGDYGFQAFERLFQKPNKWVRVWYQWASHRIAHQFLTYRQCPISRPNMTMNTASGVILILRKQHLDSSQ